MKAWVLAVLSLAQCALGSANIAGFWSALTSAQEILFYSSATPDSGNFDERYKGRDSLGNAFFQGCLGDWTYSNDTLHYRYTTEVRRDSATWSLIPHNFDSTWSGFPATVASGDTLMSWPLSNAVLEKSSSVFTLPNVFSSSAIMGPGEETVRDKFRKGHFPQVIYGNHPYTISGRRSNVLPGF